VGANSVIIHDVPANSTVVGNPGHPVRVEGKKPTGPDADWAHLPDPVADAIKALSRRVTELEQLLEEATGKAPAPSAEVRPLRNVRGSDPAGG
jgi:serine O-acetyltransferase